MVEISNPDKVYFPGLGATKFDLVAYYLAVAEALVAAFGREAGHAPTLPRRGRRKSFFQKRVPTGPRTGCRPPR